MVQQTKSWLLVVGPVLLPGSRFGCLDGHLYHHKVLVLKVLGKKSCGQTSSNMEASRTPPPGYAGSLVPTNDHEGLEVREPGGKEPLYYQRAHRLQPDEQRLFCDIIITGEHGENSILSAAFAHVTASSVSLRTIYVVKVDGDRGKWLYQGYLIGNAY
ncbi:uncharacterized protein EV420DRAFT_1484972 [Desarmillaria tabescens]|uniref:Uncharacterized protein n=1 Tax=Armillaria tabescens TaxID=1929756 RepID=A0AA39MQK9_ARMTA|nr:uncharacterized protein EV420DRAFT_1484972 [Desarmillaria tabescens]KAK0443446.1 hypothetical protein EV420DRAFT_1484972 [Desarmillaria tabescens]